MNEDGGHTAELEFAQHMTMTRHMGHCGYLAVMQLSWGIGSGFDNVLQYAITVTSTVTVDTGY